MGDSGPITPEILLTTIVTGLDIHSQRAKEQALEEQAKRREKVGADVAAMMADLRAKADERPEYFRDPVLNRFERGRRAREETALEAENRARVARGEAELPLPSYPSDPKYESHGKNRWGAAALEGNMFRKVDESLVPKNRREARKSRRAAWVAGKNLSTRMAMEELERDPRKTADDKRRGGGRHGGVAIDPETGKSRYRRGDPQLRNMSPDDRKIIKQGEKAHRKLSRKHRNQEHYLRNQGRNFFVRHRVGQRIAEALEERR